MLRPIAALLAVALAAACGTPPPPATLRNFANPLPGIYTSGQPTEAQLSALPQMGIVRVIQLRPRDEKGTGWEEEQAAALDLEFLRLPVAGKSGLTRENVERLAAELDKPRDAGVLICCASSNRVGALLALKAAWLDGESPERAMAIGRDAGLTRLAPAVEELMQPR